MNGVHDLGGMQGFGPVLREADEPLFHQPWEERVFGLFFGCFAGGHFNIDMFRSAIEQMPGHEYLRTSYYEHWLHAIEHLLVAGGVLTREAIDGACARVDPDAPVKGTATPAANVLPVEMVGPLIATGASTRMNEEIAPRFVAGAAVRTRNVHPVTHTRLPRYVRGQRGVIERDHGVFAFNDTVAHGQGHQPQHVYSVRFSARDLWGEQAHPRDSLRIDLFDSYLEADTATAGGHP